MLCAKDLIPGKFYYHKQLLEYYNTDPRDYFILKEKTIFIVLNNDKKRYHICIKFMSGKTIALFNAHPEYDGFIEIK